MPLFWLSLAFLAGLLPAALLALPEQGWLLAALICGLGACALLLVSARRNLHPRLKIQPFHAFLPLLFCLGAARYAGAQPQIGPESLAWYNDSGSLLAVEGSVSAPPDRREAYTNLILEIDLLYLPEGSYPRPVKGMLLARLSADAGFHYGDRLRLKGWLETPYENEEFSYREYLRRQGIYSYLPYPQVESISSGNGSPFLSLLYELKERLLALVFRLFPEPEASLLAGILLGVETWLPAPLEEDFQETGTAHVIAISGFNMTILAGLFVSLFSRLPALATGRSLAYQRRLGALAALLGLAAYTLLVGANPAVIRAALMGGLAIFARQLGRRQNDPRNGLNSLTLTAAAMAFFNPLLPWDPGFQLSFSATLGLILLGSPLAEAFEGLAARRLTRTTARRLAGIVSEYLLFTLAAQLFTLPVSLYHFGRLSPISLLANPLILPAQPALMLLGGLSLLLGLLWLPLGQAGAMLAWPFAAYTIRAVEFFGRLSERIAGAFPGSTYHPLSPLGAWLFFGTLLGLTWLGYKGRLRGLARSALKPGLVLIVTGAATVLVWRMALSAPDGRLHLTLLESSAGGQAGEAVLIESPGGRFVLVGGGASASALSDALGRRLPPFDRSLDWLLVGATGDEQIAALPPALERFPAANVLWAGPHGVSREARYLEEQLNEQSVTIIPAELGQSLDLGEGARLKVLAVTRRGAVLMLEWKSFHALLPLGLDFDAMEALSEDPAFCHIEILLLADSGYGPSNPPEWIERVKPQVVLLSVAAGDREGRPHPETLEALEGYTLLRTDLNGWIEITTDGEWMWVEAERSFRAAQ